MKCIIIFLSVLLLAWPSWVKACNGGCDALATIAWGVIITLENTIIFPLVGRVLYDGENPPYWKAVGLTFLASSGGGLFATSRAQDEFRVGEAIGFPLVFGAVATYLTYRNAARRTDKTSSALWQLAPQVSVSPVAHGGSIRLNWSF